MYVFWYLVLWSLVYIYENTKHEYVVHYIIWSGGCPQGPNPNLENRLVNSVAA